MALQKPLPNWLLYKRNLFYEDIAEKKSSSQTFPRHPEAAIPDPAGKVHRCSSLRRKFIEEKMQLSNLPEASRGSNSGSSRKSAQMQLFKKEVYKGKKSCQAEVLDPACQAVHS